MSKPVRVVVVGGGPVAIEAALTAKLFTEDVTIISKQKPGDWKKLGYSSGLLEYNNNRRSWGDILNDVNRKLDQWSDNIRQTILNKGIEVLSGEVSSIYPNHVQFIDSNNNKGKLYYDKLFIAIGSSNHFPANMEPDGKTYFVHII